MKIILFQPEIPQNTGNIVRTCNVTNTSLVLVKPLGFSIHTKKLKRAGLDYWEDTDIEIIEDLEKYLKETAFPFFFFSSKAKKQYSEISYPKDSLLIFGSETKGLDPIFWEQWPENFVKIPLASSARCLNLSNAVAIATYEYSRQHNFNNFLP